MQKLASMLPDFKKGFQHSAESIPELQQAVIDLSGLVKSLMLRLHRLENKGNDE